MRRQRMVRSGEPSARTCRRLLHLAIAMVCGWPLLACADANTLVRERASWLADKRTDPLDLRVEADAERIRSTMARDDCAAALPVARQVLDGHPFQLAALDAIARCADRDAERAQAATRRDQIVDLIEHTGTGTDLFTPWHVVSWTEPFEFLRVKGLRPEGHEIGCGRTEHVIIAARKQDGSLERYYFDIHEPYRACRTRSSCRLEDRNIPCAIAPR